MAEQEFDYEESKVLAGISVRPRTLKTQNDGKDLGRKATPKLMPDMNAKAAPRDKHVASTGAWIHIASVATSTRDVH